MENGNTEALRQHELEQDRAEKKQKALDALAVERGFFIADRLDERLRNITDDSAADVLDLVLDDARAMTDLTAAIRADDASEIGHIVLRVANRMCLRDVLELDIPKWDIEQLEGEQ